MPILIAPLSMLLWATGTVGLAWPVEHILRQLFMTDARDRRIVVPWFSFSAGIGYAALSTLIFLLSALHAIMPWVLQTIVGIVLCLGLLRVLAILKGRAPNPLSGLGHFNVVLGVVAFSVIPFVVFPPVGWDGLVYHLEIPRQYLLHGGLVSMPSNVFSFFPMGIEMLFLLCMGAFPPFSVQVLHAGFLLLTIVALGETANAAGSMSHKHRWIEGLILVAAAFMPTLWLDAISAYIDVALMYYSALAVIGCYLFCHHQRPVFLLLGLCVTGFLPAIKYTGFHIVFILIAAILMVWLFRRGESPFHLKFFLVLGLAIALFMGPYFVRNWIWTGDPVYPFLANRLGSGSLRWTSEQSLVLWDFLGNFGNILGSQWLYPLNFLLAMGVPTLDNDRFFDGASGPMIGLWIAVWMFRRRLSRANLFLLSTTILFALVWGIFLRQMRFLFPIVPMALLFFFNTARFTLRKHGARLFFACLGGVSLLFSAAVIVPGLVPSEVDAKANVYFSRNYLMGKESQTDYLRKALRVYRCHEFLNSCKPRPLLTYLLCTTNKNFYLNTPYASEYVIEDFTFHQWVLGATKPSDITIHLRAMGVTHILTRDDLILNPVLYSDDPSRIELVALFISQECRVLFSANGFSVLALKKKDTETSFPISGCS